MLLFARSVEEAAVMVMSALPLKDVPLMFRAVARMVAAPAVKLAPVPVMFVPTRAEGVPSHEAPEMENCVVEALPKMLRPVQVLLFARRVEEAAETVIESPLEKVVPFTVPRGPVMRLVPILEVATTLPFWSVPRSELVRLVSQVEPEIVRAVVDAPPLMLNNPLVIVDDALERKPLVKVARLATLKVPVAVMLVPMMSPATESIFHGDVVPMPRKPPLVIRIRSAFSEIKTMFAEFFDSR